MTLNGNLSVLSATQAAKLCSDAFAYISKSVHPATLCKASGSSPASRPAHRPTRSL